MNSQQEAILEKLKELPLEKLSQVEDFIDFLRSRNEEERLARAAAKLSESAFGSVWENEPDSEYDKL